MKKLMAPAFVLLTMAAWTGKIQAQNTYDAGKISVTAKQKETVSGPKLYLTIKPSDDFVSFTEKEQEENVDALDTALRHTDAMTTYAGTIYHSLERWAAYSKYPKIRLRAVCAISQSANCRQKYLDAPLQIITVDASRKNMEIRSATSDELKKIIGNPANLIVPMDFQPAKQGLSIESLTQVAAVASDPAVRNAAVDILIQTMRFNRAKYNCKYNKADNTYGSALFATDRLADLCEFLQNRKNKVNDSGDKLGIQASIDQIRMALHGTEKDTESSIQKNATEKVKNLPDSAKVAASLSSN